jgi:fructose-1,6-bisphosphatase/sedoheptulose 1,7-bisphosphatase-like protein
MATIVTGNNTLFAASGVAQGERVASIMTGFRFDTPQMG